MRRLVRVLALTTAVIGLSLIPEATANAVGGPPKMTTTVMIKPQVQLVVPTGKGLPGADVTVTYSCFPSTYGKGGYSNFGNVRLGDLAGHQGFGSFFPTCNDRNQTSVVFVPGTFSPGDGAANASVCGFDCGFAAREVKIR